MVPFRYDTTLKEYLSTHSVNIRESILLLAQLLEGIAHINAHGIAHRYTAIFCYKLLHISLYVIETSYPIVTEIKFILQVLKIISLLN